MEIFVVIMAGGVGSRFWPRSRKSKPKQLLNILGENSMIRETFLRVSSFVPVQNIFVITNKVQAELIETDIQELPSENIIAEPVGKNTAPCVAVSAKAIHNKSKDAVLVTLPADHLIEDVKEFERLVLKGAEYAYEKNGLLTFGITPTRPETGYGYINYDKESSDDEVYPVKKFVEKPNLELAEKYLQAGDYLWNSGMFIWRADSILEEAKKFLPNIYQLVEQLTEESDLESTLLEIYPKFESISIDYGIMEKSNNVYVIEGDFGWSDVGSWESVYELSEKDDQGNSRRGDVFPLKTKNSYLYTEDKFTAVIGLEDVVVINLDDSLLVCKRDAAQDVKKVVEFLEAKERKSLL